MEEKILREILQPDIEFTPIPFWFFNDTFEEEKVKNQLTDYVGRGINGIVLHPRIGVPKEMPYLSEEYFRAVRFIVKTAAELEMKVVLYDEGMYPSGSAHGKVVEANAEFASKGIVLLDREKAEEKLAAEKNAQVIAELSEGRKIVYGFSGGTIRGIHFGEDDGQPGAPKAADILNPEAVDEFIHLTHDKYYEELKEYFGTTIIAFFTDEPSALGRGGKGYQSWACGMEKEIEAAGGRLEALEGLFVQTGKTVVGRSDITECVENPTIILYRKIIKKKLRDIFYAKLSGWCESHGIWLMGHPEESNDIEEELYFHIPGQDLIMRRVAPETGGLREFDSVQAKLSADIARHLGRRRNANECFGVCYRDGIPWYMTGGDMKWYIDWLGIRGVNLYIPHAFYYSVEGERKGERPPDVGPNNIWWKYYDRFADYMKRLSYLMTDSVNGAEIAVLCDNNHVPYKEIACLYENQIEFNYLPAALLEEAEVREERLHIKEYTYKGVLNVLGQTYADRFGEKLGQMLWNVAGEETEKVSKVCKAICALGGKKPFGEIRLEKPCSTLRKVALNKNGVDMILFGNEGREAISVDVTVLGMSKPIFVDLWRGICYCVEGAGERFHLSLQPSETVLAVCSAASDKDSLEYESGVGIDKNNLRYETGVGIDENNFGYETGVGSDENNFGYETSVGSDKNDTGYKDGVGNVRKVMRCVSDRNCDKGSSEYESGVRNERNGLECGEKIEAGIGPIECRKADWYNVQYPDWTHRFTLKEKTDNKAVYVLKYHYDNSRSQSTQAQQDTCELRFSVEAQEMVECFCNGAFVDVSFWGPHRFEAGSYLQEGENEICLVITGNIANIYENAHIAFGLKSDCHKD